MTSHASVSGRSSIDPWGLFDDLPANVSVVGRHERPLYANRCWQATFNPGGVPLDDIDLGAVVHPDDASGARDAWHAATSRGAPFDYRYRVRGRGGHYRWFVVRGSPTFPSASGDWQYVCVATDIDDALRYETYFSLLARIGDVVADVRDVGDVDSALDAIGRLLVPLAGAWFVAYRPDERGELGPRTTVFADAERAERFRASWRDHLGPSRRDVDLAAQTGDAVRIPRLAQKASADPPEDVVLAPIGGRSQSHGVLALGAGGGGRDVGDAEIRLVREIARRVALALDGEALAAESRRATDDLRFLAHVGEAMVESLDLTSRLERFVNAVVPRLADWATVNLIRADGSLETLAIAHRDPALAEVADRLRGPYYGEPDAAHGTPIAMRTGRPRLLTGVDERFLRDHLRPETYADVLALGADSAFVVPLLSGGEVYGTLSAMRVARERPFSENDMWLIEELARRAAVAIDNARRYAHHTSVADAFQQASLPDGLPHYPGTAFSAFYAPGRLEATVGGDWFDAFVLRDGRLVVSIGDVSGSGLAAAVIMGSVRQLIRGVAQRCDDPSAMLDAADGALRAQFPDTLVTAFVGILDVEGGSLAHASAGHPPPLLVGSDGVPHEVGKPGLPLGMRGPRERATATTAVAPESLLVLYTDGLTESTRDIIAGEAALHAALRDPAVRTAADVARAVHDAVLVDGAHDDVAILTVRLAGAP